MMEAEAVQEIAAKSDVAMLKLAFKLGTFGRGECRLRGASAQLRPSQSHCGNLKMPSRLLSFDGMPSPQWSKVTMDGVTD